MNWTITLKKLFKMQQREREYRKERLKDMENNMSREAQYLSIPEGETEQGRGKIQIINNNFPEFMRNTNQIQESKPI